MVEYQLTYGSFHCQSTKCVTGCIHDCLLNVKLLAALVRKVSG